jgi:hypothetical protein
VRPAAAQRRLLDVQLDRVAVDVDADRHPQPLRLRAGCPQRRHVEPVDLADAEQARQVEVGAQRLPGGLGDQAQPVRREQPGQRPRLAGAERVRPGQGRPDRLADPVVAHHHQLLVGGFQA